MPSPTTLLERARLENLILTEMAGVVQAENEYEDVVADILDLIEQVVTGPLLSLTIRDDSELEHYVRSGHNVDSEWTRSAVDAIQSHLREHFNRMLHPAAHYFPITDGWCAAFPAETLTGRCCILTLGAGERLTVEREEEQLMLRLVRQVVLVLDHVLLQQRIERLETTDELTGLANYRRLVDILQYEMRRHRHSGKKLSLMLIDVEGLRSINRSYGNQYGDHILVKLASLLRSSIRPIDMVARSGLDEFAVVLPETDEEEASSLAEHLKERMQEVRFAGGSIGLSAGVGQVRPDEQATVEMLLHRAERSLSEAKRHDRSWARVPVRRQSLHR